MSIWVICDDSGQPQLDFPASDTTNTAYNDDADGESEDSDHEVVPTARRTKRQKTTKLIELPDEADAAPNYLYDALMDTETALGELASGWIESYQEDPTQATKDFINLILRLSGCHDAIEAHDIEDTDSAASTVATLQDHVRDQTAAVYPLVSKKGNHRYLRDNASKFLAELINIAAEREILYEDDNFINTLLTWVSALSSSKLRPFRHTATVVCLLFLTYLCETYSSILELRDENERVASQRKKPTKERLGAAKSTVEACTAKINTLGQLMNDIFETCFVNRYRDVDAKIRSECVRELNNWIETLPTVYFEDQYLRYFGWLLFDSDPGVRESVVNGLANLFETLNTSGFLHFTERFRSRLVEMAQHDVDNEVRAAVVEFLVLLQGAGFLEEDNVSTVLSLLVDADQEVRENVVNFLHDYCKEQTDDTRKAIGSEAKLKKVTSISQKWFGYKTVVETVVQAVDDSTPTDVIAADVAAEYDTPEEIGDLCDYLLFDTSSLSADKFEESIGSTLELNEAQQKFLLEIIYAGVDNLIKDKSHRDEIENTVIEVTPQFMDKFASSPELLALGLKLHSRVNLKIYPSHRLETSFSELYSLVCRFIKTHHYRPLLIECARFLADTKAEELFPESTLPKLSELVLEITSDFASVLSGGDWEAITASTERVEIICQFLPYAELFQDQTDESIQNELLAKIRYALNKGSYDDFLASALNLLRLESLWILSSGTQDPDTISENLAVQREAIVAPISDAVSIKAAGVYLETLVALKIKERPTEGVPVEIQEAIMRLFLIAEYTFIESLDEKPELERLPALLPSDDEADLATEHKSARPLEDLQFLLTKISLAAAAGIMDEKWNSRLTLNQSLYEEE